MKATNNINKEEVKVIVRSLSANKQDLINTAKEAKTKPLYNAAVYVNGFDKFGYPVAEVNEDTINRAERVEVWIYNSYGTFVYVYTDSQEAFDTFEEITLGSTHYICEEFLNETELNPRRFDNI